MNEITGPHQIHRLFRDLSNEEVADIEKASGLAKYGWAGGFGWDELLRSRRILIVSEAGAGKTYECQTEKARLWIAGEAAFYLDLATLAVSSVRDMLGPAEEARFDVWLRSQAEVATFFLDSIDELKLTTGTLDQALIRLNKALAGQLGRARIVITTRPVPIDRELVATHLPIPSSEQAAPTAEAFADMVMDRKKPVSSDEKTPPDWRNVGLMPLSREQMREFSVAQGVVDPDALIADIRRRDAEEFAQRPQDLIEICADWREHNRIRSHREQVQTNIATKLKPRTDRREAADLSELTAFEGASRLALAAMLTRKLTLRHSAESDRVRASEAALDVSKVLPDWSEPARRTLLERPLFGFATYGRVRFHHSSVVEFLAAERLKALIARGISVKAIKRLLFTETAQGARAVRPSMAPVAAWLALSSESVFDDVASVDPAVLLDHGDPQSLSIAQRAKALSAYVSRYGQGGWRGLHTPRVQVYRFAAPELSDTVCALWHSGVENSEVRQLLLEIVGAGKLTGCSGIAYSTATDEKLPFRDRIEALNALLQLNDRRLETISESLIVDLACWPKDLARQAIIDMFPTHLSAARFATVLRRVKEHEDHIGSLTYQLPRKIQEEDLTPQYLDELRQGITEVILDGVTWDANKYPHLRTTRYDLVNALVAACRREAEAGVRSESWLVSALLVLRLKRDAHLEKEGFAQLQAAIADLPAEKREVAFWKEADFLKKHHGAIDPWHRIFELAERGGIRLDEEKDTAWLHRRLADQKTPLDDRQMLLQGAMVLLNRSAPDHRKYLESLKLLVADAPELTATLDNNLKPPKVDSTMRRMQARHERHNEKSKREEAEAYQSWAKFWKEIADNPDAVFDVTRAENTAWNLWTAIGRSGAASRASGWDRRFIEKQFGKAIADRLRETMMAVWRKNRPTLRSERSDGEKNTFLVKWQLGLAGLAAEAEDLSWAKRLTESEAELACRYAPIELNGFPSWLESLAVVYPGAIDRVLGEELTHSLQEVSDTNAYSMFLQNVSNASEIVARLFVPRIRAWIAEIAEGRLRPDAERRDQNLRQAVDVLAQFGSPNDLRFLETTATRLLRDGPMAPAAKIWLAALLHLNPVAGVDILEAMLKDSAVAKMGAGVALFAELFDGNHGGLGVDLRRPDFTPHLLLKLLRLAHQHVRRQDDAHHEGVHWVGPRDHAERGRDAILNALNASKGPESWAAKLEMAADPLFADMKDRIIALAEQSAAQEADSAPLSEVEFANLDKTGEAPPKTRQAMFDLMKDRLDDVDDLLLQDTSPRGLWAGITDEHVMRRELARVLSSGAKGSYTVDQEAATADEKETDIRFRSTASEQQGVIELKIGDGRSGMDLFKTLHDQLLTKYMAPEACKAGILVVTIAKEREWEHPKTGVRINFDELIAVLAEEAERLSKETGGAAKLSVKGLDLRPRLAKERI
jgi:hypothetical protein